MRPAIIRTTGASCRQVASQLDHHNMLIPLVTTTSAAGTKSETSVMNPGIEDILQKPTVPPHGQDNLAVLKLQGGQTRQGHHGDPVKEPRLQYVRSYYSTLSSILPKLWNYVNGRKSLAPEQVKLRWTCVSEIPTAPRVNSSMLGDVSNRFQTCGHTSYDDFEEIRPGAVAAYAEKLLRSGYVTHAQTTTQGSRAATALLPAAKNRVVAVSCTITSLNLAKPGQNTRPKARKFAEIKWSPTPGVTCR